MFPSTIDVVDLSPSHSAGRPLLSISRRGESESASMLLLSRGYLRLPRVRPCPLRNKRDMSTSLLRAAQVRVRFAPSPTGSLHLGGLRTALANHLFARKHGGKWIVRVEDTDRARLTPGCIENLASVLGWAGLRPDAAPWFSPNDDQLRIGPYYQSERLGLYRSAAMTLIQSGKAYYDFRPPHETTSASASAFRGAGAYRPPPPDKATQLVQSGAPYTVRLFRPETIDDLVYDDLIYGHLRFNSEAEFAREGDVVLLKRDGFPTYHLASVVDDHAMGITHVLRGEEWIASLPTHLRLYHALGYTPPQFAHLPLLMTADGRKLSKRHGDASVEAYIQKGYEPAAVVNFVALLGYNHKVKVDRSAPTYAPLVAAADADSTFGGGGTLPGTCTSDDATPGEEVFTLAQLENNFDLGRLSPSRSSPDPSKLDYLNRSHIRFALLLGPDGPDGWGTEYKSVIQRSRKSLEGACGDTLT